MLKTKFNKKVIDQSNTDIYSTYWNHPPETWAFLFANDNPDRVMVRNILINECCPSVVPTKTEDNYGRVEFNRVDKFREDLLDSPALTEEAQKNGLIYLLLVFTVLLLIMMPVLTHVPPNLRNMIYPQTIDLMKILEQEEQAKAMQDQNLQSAQSKAGAANTDAHQLSYLSYLNSGINLGPKYLEHMYFYRDLNKTLEDYKNELIAKTQPPKQPSAVDKSANDLQDIPLSAALENKPELVKTAARAIIASQQAQINKQKAAADPANHKHQGFGINKEFKPFTPLHPVLKLSSSNPFGTNQVVMEFKPLSEALHFGATQNRFKAPSLDINLNSGVHNFYLGTSNVQLPATEQGAAMPSSETQEESLSSTQEQEESLASNQEQQAISLATTLDDQSMNDFTHS